MTRSIVLLSSITLFLVIILAQIRSDDWQNNYRKTVDKAWVLEDSKNAWSIKDITSGKLDDRFTVADTLDSNLTVGRSTTWIKLSLTPDYSQKRQQVIEVCAPLIRYLAVYTRQADHSFLKKEIGYSLKPTDLDFDLPGYTFMLPRPSDGTVYLEVQDGVMTQFSLWVWDHNRFVIRAMRNNLSLGIRLGIILAMLVLNLLIYLFIRDKSHLYFSLFNLSILAFFSLYARVIPLSSLPAIFENAVGYITVSAGFAVMTWCVFMVSHFKSEKMPFFWIHFHQASIILGVLQVLSSLVVSSQTHMYVSIFLVVTVTAINSVFLMILVVRKNRAAISLLISFLPIIISTLVYSIIFLGVIHGSTSANYMTLGFAMSSVLFTLGLADKIHLTRQERERYALQLERKNRELEQYQGKLVEMVDQRTFELNKTNYELQMKNRELIKAKDDAESATRYKNEFFANMSHELRTPMHHILSYAKLALKRYNTPKQRTVESLENITAAGDRMVSLLNNLLDLSKNEAHKKRYYITKTDVWEIVDQKLWELDFKIKNKRIQLRAVKPAFSTMVMCDGIQIWHVLQNLFINAIQYAGEGSRIVVDMKQTVISLKQTQNEVKTNGIVLSVWDDGPGIPSSELELIFDTFYQSSRTKTGAGGTGLGLAICKEIIEAHGCDIWAENNDEGGATFRFTLPYEMPNEQLALSQQGVLVSN